MLRVKYYFFSDELSLSVSESSLWSACEITMSVMAASANYNEVYNAVTLPDGRLGGDPSQKDPMFCWDTHFPERLSRLTITPDFTAPCAPAPATRARNPRKRINRNAARFKTQPITFDEIKEVDEESTTAAGGASGGSKPSDETKESLKNQFANFSKSMDGLVVAPFARRGEESTPSGGTISKPSPLASAQASCSSEEDHIGESHLHRGGSATSATIQRQQFRQRRKKRHTKSIEEAPELDKDKSQPQESKSKDTTGWDVVIL